MSRRKRNPAPARPARERARRVRRTDEPFRERRYGDLVIYEWHGPFTKRDLTHRDRGYA